MAVPARAAFLALPFAALALSVGACGSGSSTPRASIQRSSTASSSPSPLAPFTPPATNPTPTGAASGPAYHVQLTLSGTDAVQGTFSQSVSSCSPPTDLAGTAQDVPVHLTMPGSAPVGQAQPLSPGDIQLTIGSHVWGVASASNAPHATSGMLQRNSDGGGSASFQNLALQSTPSQQPQESGTITWTCG